VVKRAASVFAGGESGKWIDFLIALGNAVRVVRLDANRRAFITHYAVVL
jgi:hypothetical protein